MIEIRRITSREEWLGWRLRALTASDIGAVAGVDPYRTPLRVYAEKTSNELNSTDSKLMRRGRNAELMALEYLREDHPEWTIERPQAFYLDVDLKLGATPDAFVWPGDGRLVNCQIKTVAAPEFEKWDGKLPRNYLYQVVCENMLTKADDGMLVALVISTYGADIYEFPVPRHEAAEHRVCELAREFWDNIKNGVAPKPNYQEDGEIITAMHPPDLEVPAPLDLSQDNRIHQVLEDRARFKGDIKLLEQACETLDNEIIEKLDGATKAIAGSWKISRTMRHRDEVTKTIPAADWPQMLITKAKEARP